SGHGGAIRAVYRGLRAGERVQRAERSGRTTAPVRSAAQGSGPGRPRSARDGRRLHPRARVRPAADGGRGRRDRSPRHAVDEQPVDPRRHFVSADAKTRISREPPANLLLAAGCWPLATGCYMDLPFELHIALRYLLAKRKQAFISVISLISTLGVIVGVM